MDWLSFLASAIGSLAWPVATLVIVFLLRKELVGLLPFLRKLKAGPVEAEFEREVKELKTERAGTLPPEPKAIAGQGQEQLLLLQLAEISPKAAIVQAWQGLEFAARRAILQHAGSPIPELTGPVRIMSALAELKLLIPDEVTIFNNLRGLRNQAIHSPDFNPSLDSVIGYIELASRLQARLEEQAQGR